MQTRHRRVSTTNQEILELQNKVDKLQKALSEKEAELLEASHIVDKKGLAETERLKEQFALTDAANAEFQKDNDNLQLKLTKVHKETVTNHRALQWLRQFKDKNARLTRWSLTLQPYTFTVKHRNSRENANADCFNTCM